MNKKPKLCVALDKMTWQDATNLAFQLKGLVWGFKFNDLLIRAGCDALVPHFSRFGAVFCDAKVKDIPQTAANIVHGLVAAGANALTVHADGGVEMVRYAMAAAKGSGCVVYAVSALTSLDDEDCERVYGKGRSEAVESLAAIAREGGANGLVCSAAELPLVPEGMLTVIPAVRLGEPIAGDDQKAVTRGVPSCDVLVVGRPIRDAKDPVQAAKDIARMIEEASQR